MAAKKTTLEDLGEMIERGFAAVASDIADIQWRALGSRNAETCLSREPRCNEIAMG